MLSRALAAACAVLLCGRSTHASLPALGTPTIRIGAVVAATGPHALEGRATRDGYTFWSTWVNAHGGIPVGSKRYRVELVERDDESNPALTTQLTERLINEEHVNFLLGPYGSAETLAAAAVAERKGVPLVTGTGSSEKVFEQGYRQIFGVMSPARIYFRGMIALAKHMHPQVRSVAVIAANDTFSLEAQQGAVQDAHDAGFKVVAAVQYRTGLRDFTSIASYLAKRKPDVILHAGHIEESIAFVRSLYDENVHAKIYGEAVGAEIPEFSHVLQALSDDILSAAQWSERVRSRGQTDFFPATAPAYAHEFAHFARHQAGAENASASAAGLALEIALLHTHSLDRNAVRRSLAAVHSATFYGTIAFDTHGLNTAKPMVVNQLETGRLLTVYPFSEAATRVQYPARAWLDR